MTADSTLPDPPPPDELRGLGIRERELRVISGDALWWRVHRTAGEHVLPWNALRTFGPLLRFDPHTPPLGQDADGRGVWYGASSPDVALAEAFQVERTIDRTTNRPYLTGMSFVRDLAVLDVATDSDGAWATRAGGNFALSTGSHDVTRRWARHIVSAFPNLDGLRYNSRFAGGPCLALFGPAVTAIPARPRLSLSLDHPDLATRLAGAAQRLGYVVV